MANFSYLPFELNAVGACLAWASFQTDRSTEPIYTAATFKGKLYKYIFYKASSPPSPSSLLKPLSLEGLKIFDGNAKGKVD